MNALHLPTGSFEVPTEIVHLVFSVTLLWLSAAILLGFLRRTSPAMRHRGWALSIVASLVMPAAILWLPAVHIGWISRPVEISAEHSNRPERAMPETAVNAPTARKFQPTLMHSDTMSESREQPGAPASDFVLSRETNPAMPAPPVEPPRAENPPQAGARDNSVATVPSESRQPANVAILLLLAPVAWGMWGLMRSVAASRAIVRSATELHDVACRAVLDELRRRLEWQGPVRVLESRQVSVPMCVGWRDRCIVLPAEWRTWSTDTLQAILAHELMHVIRRDVGWQLTARLACAVYWFHPLAWYAAWRMRVERELACDDGVLRIGAKPKDYARTLIDLADRLHDRKNVPAIAVAMAARTGLEQRLRSILATTRSRSPVGRTASRWLAVCTLCGIALAGSLNPFSRPGASTPALAAESPSNAAESTDSEPETKSTESKSTSSAKPAAATNHGSERQRLHGIVVDSAGVPVANAEVVSPHPFTPEVARTGADGTFSITLSGFNLLARSDDGEQMSFFVPSRDSDASDDLRIVLKPAREIVVSVKDGDQQPIADAHVGATAGYQGIVAGKTDAAGKARIKVSVDAALQVVFAYKPQVGLDYFLFRHPGEPKSDPYKLEPDDSQPPTLTLSGIRPMRVCVVNEDDQPMPGISVYPWYVELPKKGGMFNFSGLTSHFHSKTDAAGIATFDAIPAGNTSKITFWTREEGYTAPERAMFDPASPDDEITTRLVPLEPVRGTVKSADGKPASDATVLVAGGGHQFDDFRGTARTDENGDFEIHVYPDQYCVFVAEIDRQASPTQVRVVRAKQPTEPVELVLQPATRVYGRVTMGSDSRPQSDVSITLYQQPSENYYDLPEEEKLPNPKEDIMAVSALVTRHTKTDEEGRFEFFAGPGKYYIIGPDQVERPHFEIDASSEPPADLEVNLHASRSDTIELTGRVVLQSDPSRGVSEATVWGVPMQHPTRYLDAVTDEHGGFATRRSAIDMLVSARSADGLQSGIVKLAADQTELTIPVSPMATVAGRLIDKATKQPLVEEEIQFGIQIALGNGESTSLSGGSAKTNEFGEFTHTTLTPGWEYDMWMVSERASDGQPQSWWMVGKVQADKAEVLQLGDIEMAPPERYQPPTIEERIARSMQSQQPLAERLQAKLREARLGEQHVLVFLTSSDSDVCRQCFAMYYGFDKTPAAQDARRALGNYSLLTVDTSPGVGRDEAQAAFDSHNLPLPVENEALWAILDTDGRLVASVRDREVFVEGQLDLERLAAFLNQHAPPLPDAGQLLNDALAQARRENKRVLIQHSGAFCAPCVLLSRYIDQHLELLSKDYVYAKLDRRFPNGDEVIDRLRNGEQAGIPWTVILDAEGKRLATSMGPDGNIGFPSSPAGVAHFERMLQTTAQSLTAAEIQLLIDGLSRNRE